MGVHEDRRGFKESDPSHSSDIGDIGENGMLFI
jgi:hypothetical protein